MENIKFFRIVNRINSVLLLVGLLGGVVLITIGIVTFGMERNSRAVEVVNKSKSGEMEKYKFLLGNIEDIPGSDVRFVTLNSMRSARGLSSGYGSNKIQNVLFLKGDEMSPSWLYDTHKNLILCVCKLPSTFRHDDDQKVYGIYLKVVKEDTDNDGLLSSDDKIAIAFIKLDGTGYKEVEQGITKIIDTRVSGDGESVVFMVQVGTDLWLKRYSLKTFSKLSERMVTGLSL